MTKPPVIQQSKTANRLMLETGIMAARLARFLETSLPAREAGAAVTGNTAFLWALFESVSLKKSLDAWLHQSRLKPVESELQPLDRLLQGLVLSQQEFDVLLLAALSESHEGLAAVLRSLHPRGEPYATAGLAAQLFCRDQNERQALRQLLETGSLVRSAAIRVGNDAPFFERSLLPAEALWPALLDLDVWPAALLRRDVTPVAAGLQEWLATPAVQRAEQALQQAATCTILITADDDETAYQRALVLAAQAGTTVAGIVLPAAFEPALLQLIRLHTLVRGAVPVLQLLPSETPQSQPFRPAPFADFSGPLMLCGQAGLSSAHDRRPLLALPLQRLTPSAKRRMWHDSVPALVADAPFLAARYPLEPATAAAVAADLQLTTTLEQRAATLDDVAASVRARGAVALTSGARLIRAYAGWPDLVLPADRIRQLHEAVARLQLQAQVLDEWGFLQQRSGARGVRLLFAGPPGTGKTLAAEVLANTLAVDLLVVDLSRMVSKWIGETEKNLAGVFDAAERAQVVLFFDEADALFGKRTEISDAHDRYANLETAYLLTRLEQFEGLAILATNLREQIDPAFLRRLEFVLDFEEPDREERYALWRCHLPAAAPLAADVNLYELAALYPVVGAVIRNAAVAAAFLAAADGVPIGRSQLIHAIRREYAKTGRAFPGFPVGMTL